jgi:hypothetical protein
MPRCTEQHRKTQSPKPKESANLATPDFSKNPWYGYRGQVSPAIEATPIIGNEYAHNRTHSNSPVDFTKV